MFSETESLTSIDELFLLSSKKWGFHPLQPGIHIKIISETQFLSLTEHTASS
jgi:hypothetical protein